MVNRQGALDQAFAALADPTRRAVLARLALGEASVSELNEPHGLSLPGLLKHLHTLERAGLISHRKQGRLRLCRLEPAPLAAASTWLDEMRAFWTPRLDRLGRFLSEEEPPWPQAPTSTPPSSSAAPTRRARKGSSTPGHKRPR